MTPTTKYGVHGYDNLEDSMHAIFMAKGPQFQAGKTLEPFNSINLYNLFCHILNIKCHVNDGQWDIPFWNAVLTEPIASNVDIYKLISPMTRKSLKFLLTSINMNQLMNLLLPFSSDYSCNHRCDCDNDGNSCILYTASPLSRGCHKSFVHIERFRSFQ